MTRPMHRFYRNATALFLLFCVVVLSLNCRSKRDATDPNKLVPLTSGNDLLAGSSKTTILAVDGKPLQGDAPVPVGPVFNMEGDINGMDDAGDSSLCFALWSSDGTVSISDVVSHPDDSGHWVTPRSLRIPEPKAKIGTLFSVQAVLCEHPLPPGNYSASEWNQSLLRCSPSVHIVLARKEESLVRRLEIQEAGWQPSPDQPQINLPAVLNAYGWLQDAQPDECIYIAFHPIYQGDIWYVIRAPAAWEDSGHWRVSSLSLEANGLARWSRLQMVAAAFKGSPPRGPLRRSELIAHAGGEENVSLPIDLYSAEFDQVERGKGRCKVTITHPGTTSSYQRSDGTISMVGKITALPTAAHVWPFVSPNNSGLWFGQEAASIEDEKWTAKMVRLPYYHGRPPHTYRVAVIVSRQSLAGRVFRSDALPAAGLAWTVTEPMNPSRREVLAAHGASNQPENAVEDIPEELVINWLEGERPAKYFVQSDIHFQGVISGTPPKAVWLYLARRRQGETQWELLGPLRLNADQQWTLDPDQWSDESDERGPADCGSYTVTALISRTELPRMCDETFWSEQALALSPRATIDVVNNYVTAWWQQMWSRDGIANTLLMLLLALIGVFVFIRAILVRRESALSSNGQTIANSGSQAKVGQGGKAQQSAASPQALAPLSVGREPDGRKTMTIAQKRTMFGWVLLGIHLIVMIRYAPFYSSLLLHVVDSTHAHAIRPDEISGFSLLMLILLVDAGVLLHLAMEMRDRYDEAQRAMPLFYSLIFSFSIAGALILWCLQGVFYGSLFSDKIFGFFVGLFISIMETMVTWWVMRCLLGHLFEPLEAEEQENVDTQARLAMKQSGSTHAVTPSTQTQKTGTPSGVVPIKANSKSTLSSAPSALTSNGKGGAK
jgi:hypothetical protein